MLATGLFGDAGITFDALTDNGSNKNMLQLIAGESVCSIVPASVAAANITPGGDVTPILVFSDNPFTGFEGYTVPTAQSVGYDLVFRSSNFLVVRSGVPQNEIDSLYNAITDYYQTDEFKALAEKAHFVPDTSNGQEVRQTIAAAADLCKRIYDTYYATAQ